MSGPTGVPNRAGRGQLGCRQRRGDWLGCGRLRAARWVRWGSAGRFKKVPETNVTLRPLLEHTEGLPPTWAHTGRDLVRLGREFYRCTTFRPALSQTSHHFPQF